MKKFFNNVVVRLILAFLGFCVMTSGCAHSEKNVTFLLPEWDKKLPPLSYWEVICRSSEGTKKMRIKNSNAFSIFVKDEYPLSVCAEPVTIHQGEETFFFKNAGCIYPFSNTLSFEGGFSASVLNALYEASSESKTEDYLAKFNWNKFIETQAQKQKESAIPYDPWKTDFNAICNAIARHQFNANLLSMKNCISMSLTETLKSIPTAEYLMPKYIPAIYSQDKTMLITVKKDEITSFLCNERELLLINCAVSPPSLILISPP